MINTHLQLARETLGRQHRTTIALLNLAYQVENIYSQPANSMNYLTELVRASITTNSDSHPSTLEWKFLLATKYSAFGELGKAETLFLDVLDHSMENLGKTHRLTQFRANRLIDFYRTQNRIEDANTIKVNLSPS